jgi:hypothetical protein
VRKIVPSLAPILRVSFQNKLPQIKPAVVVDKLIALAVDVIVPGRGAGESNWVMKNWRSLEQGAEKSTREMDIRADLRKWDEQFPEFHHELIVRYMASALASTLVSTVFDLVRPRNSSRRR